MCVPCIYFNGFLYFSFQVTPRSETPINSVSNSLENVLHTSTHSMEESLPKRPSGKHSKGLVCSFPHSILGGAQLYFPWDWRLEFCWVGLDKRKDRRVCRNVSVSRRNGQQKRIILIFSIGKLAKKCFEIPSFEIAALLSRNILQEWISWTFHLSAGDFLDKAYGVECFPKGKGI